MEKGGKEWTELILPARTVPRAGLKCRGKMIFMGLGKRRTTEPTHRQLRRVLSQTAQS